MKKALNLWCLPDTLSLSEKLALAAKVGFPGVELTMAEEGALTPTTPEAEVLAIGQQCKDLGLAVPSVATGMYWKYSHTSSDPEVRAKAHSIGEAQLRIAALLGAGVVLIVPGAVGGAVSSDDAWERGIEAMGALVPAAEATGVVVGVENVWNKFLVGPREMRAFVDTVASPWVRAYFDVGNVMQFGDPVDWIRTLAGRIAMVHLKDFKNNPGGWLGFCNLLEGDVPWAQVMKAFAEVGYEGWAAPEVSGLRQSPEVTAELLSRSVDAIFAGATA